MSCALFDFIELDEQDLDQISEKLSRVLAKHNETWLKVCSKKEAQK